MTHANLQPKGLYMLFMTEMWERFGFYAMRALLVLYMTTVASQGGLEWTNASALHLYSYYLGFVYITPVLGGWVADRWIGQRYSVLLGGVLMTFGYLMISLGSTLNTFYLSLALICLGNGFFKPNVTSILGGLYGKNDARRDAGYAIFYMGINVGGTLAGISSAYLNENYGFQVGFAAAAIGMLLGLTIFWMGQHRYLADVGNRVKSGQDGSVEQPLTTVEKQRIGVISVLSLAIVFFMAAFEQSGGLLNLYADQWTDRLWFGRQIPAALFQSLNPIFVVILSPFFSWLWMNLGARNPFTSVKIALGMALSSAGFAVIWSLTPHDVMQTCQGCHSVWLVLFYCLVTAGEICILPVIWSSVSKLAPRRYASSLMAMSLFAIGIGGYVAGQLGSLVDQMGPREIFAMIVVSCAIMSVAMLMITPWLRRWSHGIE